MNIDYIIIQAGGKGTRMENLTKNKPKALISVNNLPIIFHLFNKYPNKKFIIIGDYKYDQFKKYLNVFARDFDIKLLKSEGIGNISGIKEAVSYIPDDKSFMIIWCDLILKENCFDINNLKLDNYVITTKAFKCSWCCKNNELYRIRNNVSQDVLNSVVSIEPSHDSAYVAGVFIFKNKCELNNLSYYGSFTEWLQINNVKLKSLYTDEIINVGDIDSYRSINNSEYRCRPYNKMEINDNTVIKTGITSEGKKLINREVDWYTDMNKYGFTAIPKIISTEPLTMQRIHGVNAFQYNFTDIDNKKKILDKIIEALKLMHSYSKEDATHNKEFQNDIYIEYYKKTIDRLRSIKHAIPFASEVFININNIICTNILWSPELLSTNVKSKLSNTYFCPIHGDCTLTNTMIDNNDNAYFIDARGYFGKQKTIGDVRYDWAKLYYSVNTNFDQFNIKNSNLNILNDRVEFSIKSNGLEYLSDYLIERAECNISEIKMINSIIWMSLASHVWEDYDSMCIAFYNGLYLFNRCLI